MSASQYVTIRQAQAALGVSRGTIMRYLASGLLPSDLVYERGRRTLRVIPQEAVQRLKAEAPGPRRLPDIPKAQAQTEAWATGEPVVARDPETGKLVFFDPAQRGGGEAAPGVALGVFRALLEAGLAAYETQLAQESLRTEQRSDLEDAVESIRRMLGVLAPYVDADP
jgi:hypothetical protein